MVNVVVGISFIVVLVCISAFMAWESWMTLKGDRPRIRKGKEDESAVGGFSQKVQRVKMWPMMKLAESEIKSISLWILVIVALIGGLFARISRRRRRLHPDAVARVRAGRADKSCCGHRSF